MSARLAVLDRGSNAVRLILATVTPGVDFRVLRQERVQTRLAGHRRGLLPRAAVDQTLKAVSRFLAEVRQGSSPRVLAVATAAIRDAPNADRLLASLRRDEGVKVRTLSGPEEARLGAAAVLWRRPLDRGAIVDLGGGSLQLTRVRGGRIARVASGPLGAVRTTLRFLRHDPPRTREIQALRRETRDRLLGVLPPSPRGRRADRPRRQPARPRPRLPEKRRPERRLAALATPAARGDRRAVRAAGAAHRAPTSSRSRAQGRARGRDRGGGRRDRGADDAWRVRDPHGLRRGRPARALAPGDVPRGVERLNKSASGS